MSPDEERVHLLRKLLDHLEDVAEARADLLRLLDEVIETFDLEGKHRNLTPEQRETLAGYLRKIRGEDQ